MLGKSRDILGEEDVGWGRDEDSTAVGGRNAATAGVASTTLCVPIDWSYVRLDTESSGGMAPASHQAPLLSFFRQRIGNAISVDDIGIPGQEKELDRWFKEERSGCERRVRDLEEEVRRLKCKGE